MPFVRGSVTIEPLTNGTVPVASYLSSRPIVCRDWNSSEKSQKKAIRAITSCKWNAHTNQFKQIKMLKLSDIYNYYLARFMFSQFNNVSQEPLLSQFTTNHSIYGHNTRNRDKLNVEFARTKLMQNSFLIRGSGYWNTLPNCITKCTEQKHFLQLIKSYQISVSINVEIHQHYVHNDLQNWKVAYIAINKICPPLPTLSFFPFSYFFSMLVLWTVLLKYVMAQAKFFDITYRHTPKVDFLD